MGPNHWEIGPPSAIKLQSSEKFFLNSFLSPILNQLKTPSSGGIPLGVQLEGLLLSLLILEFLYPIVFRVYPLSLPTLSAAGIYHPTLFFRGIQVALL